jgi:hypothetical protein
MDSKQFEQLMAKLDRIMNLIALDAVKDLNPDEKIARLSDMKFQPMEIAPIVGKTPNAVRIVLHHIRRERRVKEEPTEVGPSELIESPLQEG